MLHHHSWPAVCFPSGCAAPSRAALFWDRAFWTEKWQIAMSGSGGISNVSKASAWIALINGFFQNVLKWRVARGKLNISLFAGYKTSYILRCLRSGPFRQNLCCEINCWCWCWYTEICLIFEREENWTKYDEGIQLESFSCVTLVIRAGQSLCHETKMGFWVLKADTVLKWSSFSTNIFRPKILMSHPAPHRLLSNQCHIFSSIFLSIHLSSIHTPINPYINPSIHP